MGEGSTRDHDPERIGTAARSGRAPGGIACARRKEKGWGRRVGERGRGGFGRATEAEAARACAALGWRPWRWLGCGLAGWAVGLASSGLFPFFLFFELRQREKTNYRETYNIFI